MFKRLKTDIDNGLKAFLKNADADLKLKSSSTLLYSGIKNFLLRNGKRIRPILFILSYLGYTRRKSIPYKKLLCSSLAFELLHDFLLIHDDVIDKSDLRRGKPTLHNLFNTKLNMRRENPLGSNLSIVAGDIIFAFAVKALLSLDEEPLRKEKALIKFTQAAADTGIGEFIDVVNNIKKTDKVTKKDIFLTYTLKTSKYTFEAPLVIGALLADASRKDISKLSKLGIILGQAFQMQDDLLDIFASTKETGKPVFSDFYESKKTFLIWKTYKNLTGKNKKIFKTLLEKKRKNRHDLSALQNLVKKSKAEEDCKKKILSLLDEAISIFCGLRIKTKYKTILQNFVKELFLKTSHLKT